MSPSWAYKEANAARIVVTANHSAKLGVLNSEEFQRLGLDS